MAVSSAATLCFLALCVALVVGQQQPLPKRFPGFERGNPAAPIFLQEFADYQCPDCAEANPTVEKVLAYYGPEKVCITRKDLAVSYSFGRFTTFYMSILFGCTGKLGTHHWFVAT